MEHRFVTVVRLKGETHARVAYSFLHAQGFHAVMEAELDYVFGRGAALGAQPLQDFRIRVPAVEVEEATTVLQAAQDGAFALPPEDVETIQEAGISCPRCASPHTERREWLWWAQKSNAFRTLGCIILSPSWLTASGFMFALSSVLIGLLAMIMQNDGMVIDFFTILHTLFAVLLMIPIIIFILCQQRYFCNQCHYTWRKRMQRKPAPLEDIEHSLSIEETPLQALSEYPPAGWPPVAVFPSETAALACGELLAAEDIESHIDHLSPHARLALPMAHLRMATVFLLKTARKNNVPAFDILSNLSEDDKITFVDTVAIDDFKACPVCHTTATLIDPQLELKAFLNNSLNVIGIAILLLFFLVVLSWLSLLIMLFSILIFMFIVFLIPLCFIGIYLLLFNRNLVCLNCGHRHW